jgi:hypothetical protein
VCDVRHAELTDRELGDGHNPLHRSGGRPFVAGSTCTQMGGQFGA